MKKLILPVLLLALLVVFMSFNMERLFANTDPIVVGTDAINQELVLKINSIDIDTYGLQDVIDLLGEPQDYIWGESIYKKNELPEFYITTYSDDFHIWFIGDSIAEIRYYGDFYRTSDNLHVGMSLDDVLEILGTSSVTLYNVENKFNDYTLYKDINGQIGVCYYSKPDSHVRMFFVDYKVNALYIPNDNIDTIVKESKRKINKTNLVRVNTDNIDLPFINDSDVIGKWESVDFVKKIDNFKPEAKTWASDLYLEELIFEAGGTFDVPYLTWTKGIVMHHGDLTASEYIIKEIDGATYLFFQWKSGDYINRDMTPSYYVLKKVD